MNRTLKKQLILFAILCIFFTNTISGSLVNTVEFPKNQQSFKYIIITPTIFASNFNLLLQHKQQYITSKIVIFEEILNNESFWVNGTYGDASNSIKGNPFIEPGYEVIKQFSLFNDSAAILRNFIRFAYLNWETKYILIGGDHEFIPSRRLYAYVEDWAVGKTQKAIHGNIISDHYFAALNGTWNNDFDNNFGETIEESIADEADFISEVCVGRTPVNDKSEVNIFVHKVIHYETHEKPTDIQLHQSYTNPQHIPDTTRVSEACAQHIPQSFTIYRLYEKNQMVTLEQWKNAFREPKKLLLFHVGNGYNSGVASWYQLSWNGNERIKFHILDVGGLNNTFYPIHISISCLIGDFSINESICEELLLTRNGGPSACIGNSEVGCITREDAKTYSGEYYEQLFIELFKNDSTVLGDALYKSKEAFISKASTERHYRWCFYTMNLLGDPETPIFEVRNKIDYDFDTFYVDDDFNNLTSGWNETCYSSIQEAIEKINEYGTIQIQPGIYQEHIKINKTITLKGSDKNNTIISQKTNQQKEIIQISCNSTIIKNLTITTQDSLTDSFQSLIHLKPLSNGNTISHCIIKGNQGIGINVEDSIRNSITNCIIEKNINGIIIKNTIEGLFPHTVIITCDNIIFHNIIKENSECGIFIEGSVHNYITNNVFQDNGQQKYNYGFLGENELCLKNTKWNEIDRNYWNGITDNPYKILSIHGPLMVFGPDFSKGFLFNLIRCYLIINIGIPYYPVYDYNPIQEPFEIL